ncbi:MAG TPA: c-type cytochrome [Gemmatimonadaceae bacterium]|nr:c-type cytochrome [Gemmatimonadaceae bacterium]
MQLRSRAELSLLIFAVSVTGACGDESSAAQAPQAPASQKKAEAPAAPSGRAAERDSLRLIAHDEMLPVGFPAGGSLMVLTNPYEGDKRAIGIGAQLYVAYNCIDCHGADGSGAMGPSLADGRWHFGGSAGAVFESIYQGRPDGMPQYGARISNDQIWMLTAYLRALPKKDLSTENFTGSTVERTGH